GIKVLSSAFAGCTKSACVAGGAAAASVPRVPRRRSLAPIRRRPASSATIQVCATIRECGQVIVSVMVSID
ncbi:hypothetical protein JYU34_003009, partial [Plutella xylostella]